MTVVPAPPEVGEKLEIFGGAGGASIVQVQVAQKSVYDLEARLVTRGVFGTANEEKLRRLLNQTLGAHFRITFDYRETIARTASGKYLDFVNEIPDERRL